MIIRSISLSLSLFFWFLILRIERSATRINYWIRKEIIL